MLDFDPTWLQLLIGLVSMGFMVYVFRRMEKTQNGLIRKFTPVISNVMSNMSKKGHDSDALKETESMLATDMKDGLLKIYPEIQWLLDMVSPATMEKIEENPEILPILIERYGPTFMKLKSRLGLGEGQKSRLNYDF